MADPACRLSVDVEARERRGRCLLHRHDVHVVGKLVQGPGDVEAVRPDPGTAKRGQVATDAQCGAEVAGQGTDVGARGALDLDVDVEMATIPSDAQQVEPPHRHVSGPELHLFPGPDPGVGPDAVDLDGAHRAGNLPDLSG